MVFRDLPVGAQYQITSRVNPDKPISAIVRVKVDDRCGRRLAVDGERYVADPRQPVMFAQENA